MSTLQERRAKALAIHRQGALDDADRLYQRILADTPDDGETWHYLGVLRGQQGRPGEVVPACEQALRCGFRTAAVYANLGLAQHNLGDTGEAIAALQESLRIEPGDADLSLAYADCLRADGAERTALAVLRDACERFSDDVRFLVELGQLAAEVNEGALAEDAFRHAVRLQQHSAESWVNLSNILQMRGDAAGAEAACRQALSIDPAFDQAYWYLSQLVVAAADPALAELITARAKSSDSAALRFAAGKLHNDRRHFASAFTEYAAGNRLVRESYDYSVDTDIGAMTKLTASLSDNGEALANPHGLPMPIFIVGMPRSGSTLLEQMLARHPDIDAGGEIVWLQRRVRDELSRAGCHFPADQVMLSENALSQIRERYLESLALRSKGAPFITDKLPANFLCIPVIRRLFPAALVIHARRDPLESCWSCFRHLFSGPQQFAYDLVELGRYYTAAIAYLDACGERWPEHIIDSAYEELIAAPEKHLRNLLQRLGIDWDARCLAPEAAQNVVMTASALQLRKGVSNEVQGGARNYAQFLAPLRSALGD